MSVINRMLTDLERRGAHQAPGAPDLRPAAPAQPPRTARRPWSHLALALALLVVASLLWVQRGPGIADQVRYTLGAPASAEPAPIAEVAVATPDPPQLAAVADPLQAELTGLRFATDDSGETALILAFAGEPPPLALPPLSDGVLDLWLSARSHDVAVPAPPADQDLFRQLSLVGGDTATRLRINLADDARLGFEHGGVDAGDRASIRLSARRPVAARSDSETESSDGTDGAAQAAQEPEPRTVAVDTGSGDGDHGGVNGVADADADAATATAELEPIRVAAESKPEVRSEQASSPEVRARRRYSEARDALADGNLRRSRRLLEEAIELDGDLHSAREVLVALLLRAGDSEPARNVLAEGIARAPARPAYARPYARLLIDADQPDVAAEVLEGARINAEGDLEFHALLANAYRRAGNHRAAMAEYTEALEIDSTQSSLWLGLAISLAGEGHADQAVDAFREARATGQLSDSLDRWAQQRIEALADGRGEQ